MVQWDIIECEICPIMESLGKIQIFKSRSEYKLRKEKISSLSLNEVQTNKNIK